MTTYQLDPSHSSASFTIKHLMVAKVRGTFEKINGRLEYDPQSPEKSHIDVDIDTSSITTHEPQRDAHLKSPDFFDVEKFPKIHFESKQIQFTDEALKVVGDLTIHGVTKPVVLEMEKPSEEVKDPWGKTRVAVSGQTKIKRKDFDLTWNAALEAGGFLVGEDVNVQLDVEFVKQ
jgi:polyisoprenoid-binding protein YceI